MLRQKNKLFFVVVTNCKQILLRRNQSMCTKSSFIHTTRYPHECTAHSRAQQQHKPQRALHTAVVHTVHTTDTARCCLHHAATLTPCIWDEIVNEWALLKKLQEVAEGAVEVAGGQLGWWKNTSRI